MIGRFDRRWLLPRLTLGGGIFWLTLPDWLWQGRSEPLPREPIADTAGTSRICVGLEFAATTDVFEARAVIGQVGADLAADPAWSDAILEAPSVRVIEHVMPANVAFVLLLTTRPGRELDLAAEVDRRARAASIARGLTPLAGRRLSIVHRPERRRRLHLL